MIKPTVRKSLALPIPRAAVPKPAFFAVTAYDSFGIESDLSPELATGITSNSITLAWDNNATNAAGFRLYWGTNSHNYPWQQDVGNIPIWHLAQVFPVPPPIPIYYAVYGQSSTNISGPWADLSATPIARMTNGAGAPRNFYRLREFSSTNAIP